MSKLPESLVNNDHVIHCFTFQASRRYDIIMWNKDKETIPHFHIVDTVTGGKKFHTKIRMDKPEYYRGETTKLPENDILTLAMALDYIPHKTCNKNTVWESMITSWNLSNKKQICVLTSRQSYEYLLNN